MQRDAATAARSTRSVHSIHTRKTTMKTTTLLISAAFAGISMGAVACAKNTPQSDDPSSMSAAKHACKGQNACKGQGGCHG
jgi:hypothetical protein